MAKKKVTKRKAVAAEAPKVNKSDLIRAIVDAQPDAGASIIVAELATKGIAVSPQMAATVKSRYLTKGKKGKAKGKRGPNKVKAVAAESNGLTPDPIGAIQGGLLLLRSAGGLDKAQAILKTLYLGSSNHG